MTARQYADAAHELMQARWDMRQTELGQRVLDQDIELSIYFGWFGFLTAGHTPSWPIVKWVWDNLIIPERPVPLRLVKIDLVKIPN